MISLLILFLCGAVGNISLAQPPDTPTPTPTPIPPLIIELVQLEVGKPFILNVTLNQDITQPFDFYFFVDTLAGPYTLYLNGKVQRGAKPLYRNVSAVGQNQPLRNGSKPATLKEESAL